LVQKTLGDIYLDKKDWENAAKYYKLVVDNPEASQALKISAENGYKRASCQTGLPKKGLIYGVILFVAIVLIYFAWGFIKKQQSAAGAPKIKKSAKDSSNYKELGAFASDSLVALTRLPKSLIYFVRREGAPLFLAHAENLDKNQFDDLETNWEDLSNWLTKNQGKPFVYKTERKDVLFNRTFPNGIVKLDQAEPRVGIPFIAGNRFRGIGFMASPKVKDMAGLKRYFEKNTDLIIRMGLEVGD